MALVVLLAALAGAQAAGAEDPAAPAIPWPDIVVPPRLGDPAPNFALYGGDARLHRLAEYLGKSVLVVFWDSLGSRCSEVLRALEGLYREQRARGLAVLAVNIDRGPLAVMGAAVGQYTAELGLTYPALVDPLRKTAGAYGVPGTPAAYLVDRKGRLRDVLLDDQDWAGPVAMERIRRFIGAADGG